MNRIEYMAALERSLMSLPEQERRDALEFYLNYFEDAAEGGKTEEQVISELGTPTHAAAKIISENSFRAKSAASQQAFRQAGEKKSVFHGVKGIFLAIGAVIIAMPGAFIAGAVILSLLFAALSVVFALLLTALVVPLALAASAVASLVVSASCGSLALFGFGIMLLGAAILSGTGFYALILAVVKGLSAFFSWILRKIEKSRAKGGAAK